MAQDTKIEWAHHTLNPWRGCTKVSAGCANCYAETMSKRNPLTLGIWGPNGTRVVAAEAMWREPLKWNKAAACICDGNGDCCVYPSSGGNGHLFHCPQYDRPRVFCASLADVFEPWRGPMVDHKGVKLWKCWHSETIKASTGRPNPLYSPLTMQDVRQRLFDLIDRTQNLDYLLLTKRLENISGVNGMPTTLPLKWVANGGAQFPPNVWIGTSIEDQATADERIPHLLRIPAKVRFLSVEPLLGPVKLDLLRLDAGNPSRCICGHGHGFTRCPNTGGISQVCSKSGCQRFARKPGSWTGIDWVIVGGESGRHARPCRIEWIRDIVRQCQAAGVPVFVKQVGSVAIGSEEVCRFESEQQWINKARSWLGGISGGGMRYKPQEQVACFDSLGRRCAIGRDFMQATKDDAYPVIAYRRLDLRDPKGGDPLEWPADLRVREVAE